MSNPSLLRSLAERAMRGDRAAANQLQVLVRSSSNRPPLQAIPGGPLRTSGTMNAYPGAHASTAPRGAFRAGPGAPKVGAYAMPEKATPGVVLGPVARLAFPTIPRGDDYNQQSRARFAIFAGQKLTAAQIAELKSMMDLAAAGKSATTASTQTFDEMVAALKAKHAQAQSQADLTAMQLAYAKAASDTALRNAMLSQANLSWVATNRPATQAPAQAAPPPGTPIDPNTGLPFGFNAGIDPATGQPYVNVQTPDVPSISPPSFNPSVSYHL